MPLVIPQNFMQIALYHRYQDSLRLAACTFGVEDVGGTLTPLVTLNSVVTQWSSSVLGIMHEDVVLVQAVGTIQQGGNYFTVSANPGLPGGAGDFAAPPPQVAALARKQTIRAGRAGRGRMYIPWCMPEEDVNALGRITAGRVATIFNACDDLLGKLEANDTPMQILHNEGAPGGTVPTPVTVIDVDNQVASQRRRNRA